MNSGSTQTQFVPSSRMGFCEAIHQMAMWDELKSNDFSGMDAKPEIQSEDNFHGNLGASKPEKVLRRLAQNREAARKSRLRKKAYVQQLEKCKQRLMQLEQELDQARRQGLHVAGSHTHVPEPGTVNQCVSAFEMEYGRWVEEEDRHIADLRIALNSDIGDMDLLLFVQNGLRHYDHLFALKDSATKSDVFYIISGSWRTPAERLFFWIGGFRPSELLKALTPQLEPLSEQQWPEISILRESCQQAEDALSRGMDRLHQMVAETISGGEMGDGDRLRQVGAALEDLEGLERFVGQADHLRRETLQQISRILSPRQAARGLLALGDYIQRLRALSSAWASRPKESGPAHDQSSLKFYS